MFPRKDKNINDINECIVKPNSLLGSINPFAKLWINDRFFARSGRLGSKFSARLQTTKAGAIVGETLVSCPLRRVLRGLSEMKVALTPMDFARRARRLYAKREAVIDEDLRYTYDEFLARCDRWSASLQKMGVKTGDRVAYIAPNTHAELESFYAVPQIGAVLVPINYRLTAEDFAYIVNHSGARVLCVHGDYLDTVEGVRDRLSGVERFVALEGSKDGWLDYEGLMEAESTTFAPVEIDEDDLITINYTSGTTARPKGVMITHRNAYLNVLGTLAHFQMSPEDRYLWTLPMFHANGWTFVWTVTARGSRHVCVRKVDPTMIFELIDTQVDYHPLRGADRADRHRKRAGNRAQARRGQGCASADRRRAARRRHHRTHRARSGLECHAYLRVDRDFAFHTRSVRSFLSIESFRSPSARQSKPARA